MQSLVPQLSCPFHYFFHDLLAAPPTGRRQDERHLKFAGFELYSTTTAKFSVAVNFSQPTTWRLIDRNLAFQPLMERCISELRMSNQIFTHHIRIEQFKPRACGGVSK